MRLSGVPDTKSDYYHRAPVHFVQANLLWTAKKSCLRLSLRVNSVVEIGRTLLSGDKPRGHSGHWGSCRQCQTTAGKGCEGRSLQQPRKQHSCRRTSGQEAGPRRGTSSWPCFNSLACVRLCGSAISPDLTLPSLVGHSTVRPSSFLQF